MLRALVLLATTVLTAPGTTLGTALRQDGYSVRPPEGFRMVRMNLFHGTRALAMTGDSAFLSAALVDGTDEESAVMLISVVEGSFAAAPSDRELFVAELAQHFKQRLSLPFSIDKAEQRAAPYPRVEVIGTARQDDQLRRVLAVSFAGVARHAVVVFSAPAGRWESLEPAMRESLASFRPEVSSAGPPQGVAWTTAGVAAVLLLVSILLYRRRRRAAASEPTTAA